MYNKDLAFAMLKTLEELFPDRVSLSDLCNRLPNPDQFSKEECLQAVEALESDDLIRGEFVRTGYSQKIAEAVQLQITPDGRAALISPNGGRRENSDPQLDALLEIPNRKEYDIAFERLCRDATAQTPCALILVDIDHFKNVNDSYGHKIGDEVLKQVASTLKATVHGKGKIYRYGGEEIAVLLANFCSFESAAVAERLRVSVEAMRPREEPPQITASFGVATYPELVRQSEELFEAADKALYQAKTNGRNQVIIYSKDSEVESSLSPLTQDSLSVFCRTDEMIRRLSQTIAEEAKTTFNPYDDGSYHLIEKCQYLGIRDVKELRELTKRYATKALKLSKCAVPQSVNCGTALDYILDIRAAEAGYESLVAYGHSLTRSSFGETYARELFQTLQLL